MAGSVVYQNAMLKIGATDFSTFVKSLTLNLSSAMLDNTTMGATATARISGLKDSDLSVTPNQDLTSVATVDGALWSIYNAGVDTCVEIRPLNACSTATNPTYFFNALLDKYTPFSGNVGQLLAAPFSMKAVNAMSRASSS